MDYNILPNSYKIILFLLLLLPGATYGQSIIKPPVDTTGITGKTSASYCEITFGLFHEMQWEFNGQIIYSFSEGQEDYPIGSVKYTVTNEDGNFSLLISNLQYNDGGVYTCATTTFRENAILIVLGKPKITAHTPSPVEGDIVNFTCEASFGGPNEKHISLDQFPKMRMLLNDNPLDIPTQSVSIKDGELGLVYNMTVTAHTYGKQLKCEVGTTFPAKKVSSFVLVDVVFAVRNVSYFPQQEQYKIGSVLTCTADGNPPPSIEWDNLEKPGWLIKSEKLNITEDMTGYNSWRCIARNYVKGVHHEESVATIFDTEYTPENTNGVLVPVNILIVVFSLGTTFCLVLLSHWIHRRKHAFQRTSRQSLSLARLENYEEESMLLATEDATQTKSIDFMNRIQRLQTMEDFEKQQQQILEDSGKYLLNNLKIFLVLVEKAHMLLESTHYIKIIKEMAKIYKTASKNSSEGPLGCVGRLVNDKEAGLKFVKHQNVMHSLIQILVPLEHSGESKNKFLMDLITRSEYISSESIHTFEWTEEFISTLECLLKNDADPTWITDDWQTMERHTRITAQYQFCRAIIQVLVLKKYLLSTLKDVFHLFLRKSDDMLRRLRGTPLHALTELDWKRLTEQLKHKQVQPIHFFQEYRKVLCEALEENKFLDMKDMRDWNGRTPLHLFLFDICLEKGMLESVSEIVELLKSAKNGSMSDNNGKTHVHYIADAFPIFHAAVSQEVQEKLLALVRTLSSECEVSSQDEQGSTALHILVKKSVPNHCKELFQEMVKIFANLSSIAVQDNQWCTPLHLCTQRVSRDPEWAVKMLSIFPILTTTQNVNMQDKLSRTPYTWVILGKREDTNSNSGNIFKEMETILLENGADSKLAKTGYLFKESQEFEQIIDGIQREEDLDSQRQKILSALKEKGQYVAVDIGMLSTLVMKASSLIESRHYNEIVKLMATMCPAGPYVLNKGPLHCLLEDILKEEACEKLFKQQDRMLSLIQVLIPLDSVSSRTKFLMVLLTKSEYILHSVNTIKWTKKFASILQLLVENGADPTWVADGWETLERRTRYTAQYEFFWVSMRVLLNKNHLFSSLVKMIPLFMTHKKSYKVNIRGTPLHALIEIDWEWFSEYIGCLPLHFFQQYKEIITQVTGLDPDIVNMTDWYGRTPLHIYLDGICLDEKIVEDVIAIAKVLKSDKGISTRDQNCYTVLHYFAESFPVYHKELPQGKQQALLNFVEDLTSPLNIDAQDSKGNTPLHILAEKYPWDDPGHSLNTYLEVLKYLASRARKGVQNQQGFTVLHAIANKYNQEIGQNCMGVFTELVELFQDNATILDNEGCNALHILSRKISLHADLGKHALPIFTILAKFETVNLHGKHLVTPYTWILRGKQEKEKPETGGIFSNIENIFHKCRTDVLLAKEGLPYVKFLEIMEMIEKTQGTEDFNSNGGRIIDMLNKDDSLRGSADEILFNLLKKTGVLFESDIYMELIEILAEFCKLKSKESRKDPLECLLLLTLKEKELQVVYEHQNQLHSLIKLLTPIGRDATRTKTLMFIISQSEFMKQSPKSFHWTEDFILTVKLLMEEGADPTWIADEWQIIDRNKRCTAQYKFFRSVVGILLQKEYLYASLGDVVPMFLKVPKQYSTEQGHLPIEEARGSPLHALVEFDWRWLNEQHLTDVFFTKYAEIINTVIKWNHEITDITDWYGRTPLQLFIEDISLQETHFPNVKKIMGLLTTIRCPSKKNIKGQTILHSLAEAFPIFDKSISLNCQETFIETVRYLKDDASVDAQDKSGSTVLHVLVQKYTTQNSKTFGNFFKRLVKIFRTNSNICSQDNRGQTVLHILSKKVCFHPVLGNDIVSIWPDLTTEHNVNVEDDCSMTPYSWIIFGKLKQQNSKESRPPTTGIFSKIEEVFISKMVDTDRAKRGSQKYQETEKLNHEFKLKELDEYISLPKRHKYIKACIENLSRNLIVNDEMLDDLVGKGVIDSERKHAMQRLPKNEKVQDMITVMLNTDKEAYHNFLEVLANSNQLNMVDLLTDGKWRCLEEQTTLPVFTLKGNVKKFRDKFDMQKP